jgi:hypothetical protein
VCCNRSTVSVISTVLYSTHCNINLDVLNALYVGAIRINIVADSEKAKINRL